MATRRTTAYRIGQVAVVVLAVLATLLWAPVRVWLVTCAVALWCFARQWAWLARDVLSLALTALASWLAYIAIQLGRRQLTIMEEQRRIDLRKHELASTASLHLVPTGSAIRLMLRNDGTLPIESGQWELLPFPEYWIKDAAYMTLGFNSRYRPLDGATVKDNIDLVPPGASCPLLYFEFDVAAVEVINTTALGGVKMSLTYVFGTREMQLTAAISSDDVITAAKTASILGPETKEFQARAARRR
jgi:hypothetical protein